jgi:hypothetical protein
MSDEDRMQKALKIVAGMEPWFRDINKKKSSKGRTQNEACFDSGVFAASEFIRRLTGDGKLALCVHECCLWRREERRAARLTTTDREQ